MSMTINSLQVKALFKEAMLELIEGHFGTTLPQIEAVGLPSSASLTDHEAYLDWVYWHAVVAEKTRLLAEMDEKAA